MTDADKYAGKTAAELLEILNAKDEFTGKQAEEIGTLRTAVKRLDEQAKAAAARVETGSARKEQYRTLDKALADEVIMDTQKGLGKVMDMTKSEAVNEAEQRVFAKLAQKQTYDNQIAAFMRDKPVLQKWSDVFSVAGAQIFNANPNASLTDILAEAKKATEQWLVDKGIKPEDEEAKLNRVKAGVTTSGGAGSRDTEGTRGRKEESEERSFKSTGDTDKDSILQAIGEIKGWKEKRQLPPRSR